MIADCKTILTPIQHKQARDTMNKAVLSQNAPKPIGPYSQAVQAGNFLFVSGQLAIDPKDNKLIVENVRLQTHLIMENIKAILESAGYCLKDIVQVTVYLSSMTLFEEFNVEYAKFFDNGFPARSLVASELKRGALLEVSVVAYKD